MGNGITAYLTGRLHLIQTVIPAKSAKNHIGTETFTTRYQIVPKVGEIQVETGDDELQIMNLTWKRT